MFELALTLTVLECIGLLQLANKFSKCKYETEEICEW